MFVALGKEFDMWRPFFTNQRLVSEFAQVPVHVMSDRQPDQFQDI